MSELVGFYEEGGAYSRFEYLQLVTPAAAGDVRSISMNPYDWNMLLIETANLPRDLVKVIGDWHAKLMVASAGRFFEIWSEPSQPIGEWKFS